MEKVQGEAVLRENPGAARCSSPPERQPGSRSTFRAAFPNSLRALRSSRSPGARSSGAGQIRASAAARCLNTGEGTASQPATAERNATAATLPKCRCDTKSPPPPRTNSPRVGGTAGNVLRGAGQAALSVRPLSAPGLELHVQLPSWPCATFFRHAREKR